MAELKKQYGACLQTITQGRGQTVRVSVTGLPGAGSASKMSAVCFAARPNSQEMSFLHPPHHLSTNHPFIFLAVYCRGVCHLVWVGVHYMALLSRSTSQSNNCHIHPVTQTFHTVVAEATM